MAAATTVPKVAAPARASKRHAAKKHAAKKSKHASKAASKAAIGDTDDPLGGTNL